MRLLVIFFLTFFLVPGSLFAVDVSNTVVQPFSVQTIVTAINKERIRNNLPAFTQNTQLQKAAQLKADNLASRGVLEHTKISTNGLWWPLESAGYQYHAVGENLSQGINDSQELVSEWMASPEHRINIVNPLYSELGIAIAKGTYRGSETSFVVMYSAKPKPPVVPKKVLGVSTTNPTQAELLRQLIALLSEYLSAVKTQ